MIKVTMTFAFTDENLKKAEEWAAGKSPTGKVGPVPYKYRDKRILLADAMQQGVFGLDNIRLINAKER